MRQLQLGTLHRMRVLLFGQGFVGGDGFGYPFLTDVDFGKVEQVFNAFAVVGEFPGKP